MRVDALNSRETLVQTDVLLHELSVGEALRDAAAAEPDRLAVVDPASGRRLRHGLRVGMAREIEQRTARASALSGSDHSARGCHSEAEIAAAIRRAIRSHAAGGCAGAVAAAYGEHPETAASRMRWARATAERISSSAVASPVADPKPWRHLLVDGGVYR